jgi:hypothetical protein
MKRRCIGRRSDQKLISPLPPVPYFEGAPRPQARGQKRIPVSRFERLTSSLRKRAITQLLVTRSTN